MLDRLARGVVRHPLIVIATWVVVGACSVALAMAGVAGEGLFERVNSGEPLASSSQSTRADAIIADAASVEESVTLVISGVDLTDPQIAAALAVPLGESAQTIGAIPGVASAINPLVIPGGLTNPAAEPLVATGRDGLLEVVEIDQGLDADATSTALNTAIAELRLTAEAVREAVPGATAIVGGGTLIADAIIGQMEQDLLTGEVVALPIALVVMVFVFAGFIAAFLPLFAALAAIASTLGGVFALTYLMDVHTSVINVVTIIGVGLSIDYGLLIVSRFREELRTRASAPVRRRDTLTLRAMIATMTSAGRTVSYSALTIAAAIAGLIAFKPSILRTYGVAGFLIVLIALLTAVTLVPACLALLGSRMIKPSPLARLPFLGRIFSHQAEVAPETGVFSRLAAAVQAKPWFVIVGVLAIVGLLASPIAHMKLRNSDVEFLPANSDQREWLGELARSYPASATPQITVVALGTAEQAQAFADSQIAEVEGVTSTVTVPRDGYIEIDVFLTDPDSQSDEARAAVHAIRQLPAPMEFLVTGPSGRLVDFVDQLRSGAPWAAAIIALTTLLLLFAMTGSVLIPIKALMTNVLSLAACLGVLTWLFQDGHFGGVLGFDAVPGVETYIVVLLTIFGFGLAMDYEMFLISRIKEAWDAGDDSDTAVRHGLQRSGRIITSAALIIIVVFSGFAAGELIIIKEIGIGLAVAVALDATLVRMLLVPATMTVLGRWNWWSPQWMAGARKVLRLDH